MVMKGGALMSEKSKRGPKRKTGVEPCGRPASQGQACTGKRASEEEVLVRSQEKRFRLLKYDIKELEPDDCSNMTVVRSLFVRFECDLLFETVPPAAPIRFATKEIWRAELRGLPDGKFVIPVWRPPFLLERDTVVDVDGFEWIVEDRVMRYIPDEGEKSGTAPGRESSAGLQRKSGAKCPPCFESLQVAREPLSKKQISARRKGGEARALIEKKDEAKILAKWSKCPKGFSKNSKADITAKWCDTEGLLRKDGDRLTPRNILELVRRRIEKKLSK
jgi:hypothetical protein